MKSSETRYRLNFVDYLGVEEDIGWFSISNKTGVVTEYPYRDNPHFTDTTPRRHCNIIDYVNNFFDRNQIHWNEAISEFCLMDDFGTPQWDFELKVRAINLTIKGQEERLEQLIKLPSIIFTLSAKHSRRQNDQLFRTFLISELSRFP